MLMISPHFIQQNVCTSNPIALSQSYFNLSADQNLFISNNSKSNRRTRSPFSMAEDNLLIQLVKKFGIEDKMNWYIIALHLQGRSARQCRERYQLYLSDGIKRKEKWTKEEDDILISKYEILGPQWKKMEQFLKGRTSYSIKNRFISLKKKSNLINDSESHQNNYLPGHTIVIKRYCLPLKFNDVVHENDDLKGLTGILSNSMISDFSL